MFSFHIALVESDAALFYKENTFSTISVITQCAQAVNIAAKVAMNETDKKITQKAKSIFLEHNFEFLKTVLEEAVLPIFHFVRSFALAFSSSMQIAQDVCDFLKMIFSYLRF